jgi:signal peptidase I
MVRLAAIEIALAALATLAILFAPTSVLGKVTYATTSGTSMAPAFATGDIVLLRKSGPLQVGDIAGYRNGLTGQIVVHRVIAERDGRLTFKGDNNWWADSYQPTQHEVVGKLWVHLEGAGKYIESIRPGWFFGILGGLVGLTLMRKEKTRPVHGRRRNGTLRASFVGEGMQALLVGLLILGAISGIVAVAAFRTPAETTVQRDVRARHSGVFSYSGKAAPGPVYQDDVVRTGDPVYVNLVPKVTVTFSYNLDVPGAEEVRGTIRLFAVTRDITGWEQTATLVTTTPFEGTRATVSTEVQVADLMALASAVQDATGNSIRYFTSALTAEVMVTGTVDGQVFQAPFQPFFTLRITPPNEIFVETSMTRDFESVPPIHGSQEGAAFFPSQDLTIAVPDLADNTMGLLAGDVRVERVRVVAGILAAGSVAGALVLMELMALTLRSPAARVQARYGSRLVRVAEMSPPGNTVTLDAMADLVRLADRYQSPILWAHAGDLDLFSVQEGPTTFVFREVSEA